MESTEQKSSEVRTTKDHACPADRHCCDCEGCGATCTQNPAMPLKKYWVRHFIILVLSVIAAFYVGMKLGEIKGYLMASYGGQPMQGQRFMMGRDDQWGERTQVLPTTETPPVAQ